MVVRAGAAAREKIQRTSVPASVTVAQAVVESDWGRSGLTKEGNNFCGIEAQGGAKGTAGVVWTQTKEFLNDDWITVDAPCRASVSAVDSFLDHVNFLLGPRYRAALVLSPDTDECAPQTHQAS